MVRVLLLAALGALAACLEAPGSPSGAEDGAGAVDAALPPACETAFAVAYISRVSVHSGGAALTGMLVIEALGDGVVLDDLTEGEDDSYQVELEMVQPSYGPMPAGLARGRLDPACEEVMVDQGLIDPGAWDGQSPTFRLAFSESEALVPHRFSADVIVGESRALLEFEVNYVPVQEPDTVPLEAARVTSVCGG